MTKKLIISSKDVLDWNGVWFKGVVEQEMKDLNQTPKGNDWIEWVLYNLLDSNMLPAKIESFIIECDELKTMKLMLDYGEVTIKKI